MLHLMLCHLVLPCSSCIDCALCLAPSPTGGFSAQFDTAFRTSGETMPPGGLPPSVASPQLGLGDLLEPTKTGQFTSEPAKPQAKGLGRDLSSGLNRAFEG